MKEKDFDKHLDNLIIDGLIKEAEQDNADFEAAMRKMSDEDFEELIYESAYADQCGASEMAPARPRAAKKSKWQVFRPWITSAVAAAAVVLIILIPSVNAMNDKLCDSVLYASSAYITPSKGGFDISSASIEQLKVELPKLEKRYGDCIIKEGRSTHYTDDLQEAGWDLTLAYLRLHKKGDAIKVLEVLSTHYKDTPFGVHCQKMLDQLQ